MRTVTLTLLLSCLVLGQEKPKPAKLTELSNAKLLAAYEKVLLAQRQAQDLVQRAVADYQKESEAAVRENHLATGTTFNVNIDSGQVTPLEPAKKPEKK